MGISRAERWDRRGEMFRGLKRRVVATVGLLVGGLVWIVLYLAFLAGHFAWYQNLAIILSTFLVVPTVVIVMWVLWGLGLGRRLRGWADESIEF